MASKKKPSIKQTPKKDITVSYNGTLEDMLKMAVNTKSKDNSKQPK